MPAVWKDPAIVRHFGIPFWNGTCRSLLEKLKTQGGLLVVPSGPNLTDCRHDVAYKLALRTSDIAVMDSGFLALILKSRGHRTITRISGLQLLEVLLQHSHGPTVANLLQDDTVLWVVPDQAEASRILRYLSIKRFDLTRHHIYKAPFYSSVQSHPVEDPELLLSVKITKPNWVILCVAGGKQEKLGLYLRNQLQTSMTEADSSLEIPEPNSTAPSGAHSPDHASFIPAILCTGAAIAFLTGGQAHIPKWADRLYLGWFFRILQNPKKYTYRYFQALRLPFILSSWNDTDPQA